MRAVVTLTIIVAATLPTSAHAYRTFADSTFCVEEGCTETGVPQISLPVPYELDSAGSDDLPFSDVERAVREAYEDWGEPACTSMALRFDGTTDVGATYADDRGVVTWVESGWAGLGFSTFELGVTTQHVSYRAGRWVIASADTQLNGVDYAWRLGTTSPFDGEATVGDVVRHEAGHALGIDHPCEFGSAGVPECDTVGPTLGETPIMWPRSRDGGRDTLKADDIAAICWLYPATTCPGVPCAVGEMCVAGVCEREGDPMRPDTGRGPDTGVAPDAGADSGTGDAAMSTTDTGGAPPPPMGMGGSGGCSATSSPTGRPIGAALLLFAAIAFRRRRL